MNSNAQLFDESYDNTTTDLSSITEDFINEFSEFAYPNQDFANMLSPATLLFDLGAPTPDGHPPENNSNSNTQELSMNNNLDIANSALCTSNSTCLKMIAQPYYSTKLRYRSDYEKNENRLGVLRNTNPNSSYQGPAISIPSNYRDPNGQYYIRVSLVTVLYKKTNLQYFHAYEIEDPRHEEFNDRSNNVVWIPIESEECITGIKSFPSLRIVKKKAAELKAYGNLRVFDCNKDNIQNCFLPQLSSPKETISEYNLDKTQLAFTIGQKILHNGQICIQLYSDTTVFSDEMIEGCGKELDTESDIQSLNGRTANLTISNCRVYKYAPRSGFAENNEDMIIYLTAKIEPRKHGELQVIFQYLTTDFQWTKIVNELDIKDRIVAFKIPVFEYSFQNVLPVDIILRQNNRDIEKIRYFYLSSLNSCPSCQLNTLRTPTNIISNIPNKRPIRFTDFHDDQHDGVVPVNTDARELRQSQSQPETSLSSSSTASNFTSLPSVHLSDTSKKQFKSVEDALAASIEELFVNNDDSLYLRVCRPFIKSRPQLCHDALTNNHTDILLKFIPIATIDILKYKNDLNETILFHAIRLNHFDIVKKLLEHKDSKNLLEDVDHKMNNIFHILTLHSTSKQMFDLLINYCLKNNISIQEKFDQFNQDYQTPLQLAIHKNNLLAIKCLLVYSNTNICDTQNRTGDNLIHLAVRYGDLKMVKYLIEDGDLIQQGNQSNLTMTPYELAQALKRNDVMEYLKNKYSLGIIDESDEDED